MHGKPTQGRNGSEFMKTNHKAFTRLELTATVAAVALLSALAAPILGTTRTDSERAACFNNLRQIGRAVRQWSGDYFEEPPWLTSVSNGGTKPVGGMKAAAAWVEYVTLSNELVTPRILACPSDAGVNVASAWGTGSNGLIHPSLRASAISYGIGLHAYRELPRALVAFDRNLLLSSTSESCGPAAANGVARLTVREPNNNRWTNGVHGLAGHMLLNDGSVRFVNSAGLRSTGSEPGFDDSAGTVHLFRAR